MNDDFDRPNSRFSWLTDYWAWATSGSSARLAAATGGPVLLLLLILAYLFLRGGDDSLPGSNPSATVATGATATQAPAGVLATATATVVPAQREYTVQSGDSLLAICFDLVENIEPDECVSEIVRINSLVNAGQIAVDQVLILPSAATPSTPPSTESGDTGSNEPAGETKKVVLSCDHRLPGVESDVIVRGSGFAAGEVVSGKVTGSGLVGDGQFEAVADAEGAFEVRVPIKLSGDYSVDVADFAPQRIDVGAVCEG